MQLEVKSSCSADDLTVISCMRSLRWWDSTFCGGDGTLTAIEEKSFHNENLNFTWHIILLISVLPAFAMYEKLYVSLRDSIITKSSVAFSACKS